jgi:hypothetical protein
MTAAHKFARVVLGIRQSAPRQGLQQAADLAALLHAELRGLFLRQDELTGLASMPFAKEFRPLEGGWHRIEREQLSHAVDIAARSAERCFSELVRERNLPCEFEVVQGSIAQAIASISRADDILVIPEPASSTELVTFQFSSLIEAAFGSAAAVMVVPAHIARETGPVVALVSDPEDASIETAAAIAGRARERFEIVDVSSQAGRARGSGQSDAQSVADDRVQNLSYSELEQLLQPLKERLLVLSRGLLDTAATGTIASTRHVPVLVVEPAAGGRAGR